MMSLGGLEIMIRDSVQIDRLMSMKSFSADSILDLVSVSICGLQTGADITGLLGGMIFLKRNTRNTMRGLHRTRSSPLTKMGVITCEPQLPVRVHVRSRLL